MGQDMYLDPPPGPPQDYAVLTTYLKPGRKKPIMHAWGPCTQSRAQAIVRRYRKGYAEQIEAGQMFIVAERLQPTEMKPTE